MAKKNMKQDRTFTRTAEALERKLGVRKAFAETEEMINDTRGHVDEVVKKLLLEVMKEVDALKDSQNSYKLEVRQALNGIAERCNEIEALIGSVGESVSLALTSAFSPYGGVASNNPYCKKNSAGTVELWGVVSPSSSENNLGTETLTTVCTLPEGYRPHADIRQICQGDGLDTWLLTVATDGTVSASRYRYLAEDITAVSTSAWMPFSLSFMAEIIEEGGTSDG